VLTGKPEAGAAHRKGLSGLFINLAHSIRNRAENYPSVTMMNRSTAMTEHIVLYGKGGVGTSTLASNISAALVEAGFRVLQIGCSLKGDSSCILNGGSLIPTVWEQYEKNGTISFDTVVSRGFKNTYCIELGRSQSVQGLSGTAEALDLLQKHNLITSLCPDYVLYDISGDQTFGVIQALSERIDLHRIFAVTTADFMSLTNVNSIMVQLEKLADNRVPIPFGGLLPNGISSSFEESFIADFAKKTGTHTLGRVPRSLMVRQCELYGKTVIEAAPLSNQSYFYRRLANQIVDESYALSVKRQPNPFSREQLRSWAREWADRLFALENGLVSDGAAI
jgi:nitrogenase iron protein NifH